MKPTIIPGSAIVAAAIGVLSMQTVLASPAPDRPEFPPVHLAGTVSGREAVSALGSQLPAIARAATASLASMTSIWSCVKPAFLSASLVAGIGPSPLNSLGTPETA